MKLLGPTARHLVAGGLLGLVVLLAAWLDPLGYFRIAELKALDSQFDLRGPLPASAPIVIVTIDDDSFDALDRAWPWARAEHARLLDIVSRGKPLAVGFDILFAEESARGPKDDAAFSAALARAANVVLAAAYTPTREAEFTKLDFNPPIKDLRAPTADCAAPPPPRPGAKPAAERLPCGFGFANFDNDIDAFVRRAALVRHVRPPRGAGVADAAPETELPAFALLVLEQAARRGLRPAGPLPAGDFIVNYRGPGRTFPSVSYHRVLTGEVPPEAFANQIVLVGATTPTLHDLFPAPFAPLGDMPGVEIHANVIETLLLGVPIHPVRWGVAEALTLAAGAFAVLVVRTLRPTLAFGAVAGGLVAYLALTHLVFRYGLAWMGVVTVPLALALGYTGAAVRNFVAEQREKRRLSRFFSPSVVREIVRGHDAGEALESSRRRLTVLFSDIRGFTSMSERIPPEDVVTFLREYLTEMTDAVFKHGGTVDKYIGDAIMALYNVPFEAPDHAAQAVRTALEFQRRLEGLARRYEPRLGAPLRCGVGIHTGDAVVGTLGSAQRLEYTAIGDTVNLGSRLEGVTKDFDVPIVLSEATWTEVKDVFATRYLGEVTVKGKEVPVRIYTVIDDGLAAG
ncbi:MAG TPA: adenylate/guanylate cyclase domain-containing protein [Methylomirabilota bacterium]|nr:adenylate/guanylate cyclase domain-containing protein [Methylomirabilota bacterium]